MRTSPVYDPACWLKGTPALKQLGSVVKVAKSSEQREKSAAFYRQVNQVAAITRFILLSSDDVGGGNEEALLPLVR